MENIENTDTQASEMLEGEAVNVVEHDTIPKLPENANLIDAVTDALREAGHPDPEAWKAGLHEDATITDDQKIQRFLVNRCLFKYMAKMPHATLEARAALLMDGDQDDWHKALKTVVVPCIMLGVSITTE